MEHGDETWIYHRQIGRKSSNATWGDENEPPRTIVRQNRSEPRILFCLFFKSSGPVLIHKVDKGKTIDHNYYIENCLKSMNNKTWKQETSSHTQCIELLHDILCFVIDKSGAMKCCQGERRFRNTVGLASDVYFRASSGTLITFDQNIIRNWAITDSDQKCLL
jgi:hypothetical protein